MIAISVDGVAKRYRQEGTGRPRSLRQALDWSRRVDWWALQDLTFEVAQGETIGLIGANGSGKSTTLRVLAGLTQPTRGRISTNGRVNGLLSLGEGVHPLLTGEENAVTLAILAGLKRREAVRALPDVAAFAGLETHMDQPLRTYSSGMRLRLAFAVAAQVPSDILLVDEILSVGDLRFQEKCLAHLEGLQADGTTIVLASHDLGQVRRLCTRALWLDGGRTRRNGPADEVVDAYENAMAEHAGPAVAEADGSMRMGTREVEIAGVRLLDRSGRRTTRIPAGGALTVEIDFVAHHRVADAVFGVSAHTQGGQERCFDLSTAADGRTVGALQGPGTVRLHLERLDLVGGSYRLDVGVYEANWDRPYDYLWHAFPFEVGAANGTRGPLAPPHHWSMS